jgi:hypothetical protein
MSKVRSVLRVTAAVGLLCLSYAGRAAGQDSTVAITYAAPDANQTKLFVNGQNFGDAATVFLGETQLAGVVVDVLGKSLTADLPPGLAAGSYLVLVSNGPNPGDTSSFVVHFGASNPDSVDQPGLHSFFLAGSGNATTTGVSNTGLGAFSLRSNTTGQSNTALGVNAMKANAEGSNNTAVGVNALFSNTSGSSNTATGLLALASNTTGSYNTASGEYALSSNADGLFNTGVGWIALTANVSGSDNSAVGKGALRSNTVGLYNTAVGVDSQAATTAGVYNTSIGVDSLYRNISGIRNFAGGPNALVFNESGSENTATGMSALFANVAGNGNTAVGYGSLFSNVDGHQITAVGYLAGGSVTTGNFSLFLGNEAGFNAAQKPDPYNSIALGNGSYTTKDNQVVIGNTNITETVLNGNVIVGAPSRPSLFQINGTSDATDYRVGGVTGVSCSGPPTKNFKVVNGIVTAC